MAGTVGQGSRLRRVGALVGGASLVLTALASCGSSTIQPATVYVTSSVGPGADMTHPCGLGTVTPALEIGSESSGVPTGHGTTVTCSVTPSGKGFAVSAFVESIGGTVAGSFRVSCTMPVKGTGTGISSAIDFGTAAITYSDTKCMVTMANNAPGTTTPGFDPSNGPAIAPGRVWATVTCNDMTVSGQSGICQGILTFRLENCDGSPTS